MEGNSVLKNKIPGKILLERKGDFVTLIEIDHKPVVIKARNDTDKMSKHLIFKEKVALHVLKGLAVPKLIHISTKKAQKILKLKKFSHLAMEWVPFKGCWARQFTPAQSLGLWAFTVEQMCAFHRKGVLYTDMKHNHLRLSEDMTQACIVDVGASIMVEPKGVYDYYDFGQTNELLPPEFCFQRNQTERVLVYTLGMLLGSFLLKFFHNFHINPQAMKTAKSKLMSCHQKEAYELFENCISFKPQERPKDIETLFKKIEQLDLPEKSIHLWSTLRKPYEKELRKLGFKPVLETQNHKLQKAA